jgi:hypothetical protein
MEIKQVDIECVDVFWDKVKYWIERATIQSNGRHNLDTTYSLLKSGTMKMFLVVVNKYKTNRKLFYTLCKKTRMLWS